MSASIAKFYTMTMVFDKNGNVLVLDRTKSDWPGLTFPGGRVEYGESFYDCAVRETKEETGLDVKNLIPCGTVHWANKESGERYIEFLYKTSDFCGDILSDTNEGKISWMSFDELCSSKDLSANFEFYLPMFRENHSEMFFEWDGKAFTGIPTYK